MGRKIKGLNLVGYQIDLGKGCHIGRGKVPLNLREGGTLPGGPVGVEMEWQRGGVYHREL